MNKTEKLERILELLDITLEHQTAIAKLEIAQHIENSIEGIRYDDYELRVNQELLIDFKEELIEEIKEILNEEKGEN